jgi:hypothetical protein
MELMSILFLNMPFAIEKRISVSALSSDYFDIRRCGSNNTFLLITRHFICSPNL